MKETKVAIYARVSTVGDKQDPETQKRELREYVKRHRWEIFATYTDYATGANTNRKNLAMMMQHAKEHRFDIVLVWSIDRFSRSVVDFYNLLHELEKHDIRFIAMSQGIDYDKDNPAGVLMMHVLAAVAQFERGIIRQRVMSGLARAKAKGVKLGPKPIQDLHVGYLLERHKAGDSLREIRRKYRERFGKGVSIETIRKYLKIMAQSVE